MYIQKIKIIETPPISFTLSPSSVNKVCGTALSQTFTVNNVNNTSGVTSYSWNLGSATNGWLYNGSPAPQTILTATNTLTLSAIDCNSTPLQNINASAVIGSANYATNASAISNNLPALSISGGDAICGASSTYSIPNVPCNASISWLSSNPNIASVPPGGNPVTVTVLGQGGITLSATISNACNITPDTIAKNIYVGGVPDNTKLLVRNQTPCAGFPVGFGANYGYKGPCTIAANGIIDVKWDISSPYSYQIEGNYSTLGCDEVDNSGRVINFSNHGSSYTAYIRIMAKNSCGWSNWSPYLPVTIQSCYGGWSFIASPNPATNSIEISLDEQTIKSNKTMSILEIQITDKLGNIVKQVKFDTNLKRSSLNISELKPNVYFVRVFNGKEWKVQSIIKQ